MFRPPAFREDDAAEVVAMLRSTAFAHLVAPGDGGLDAAAMPFLVDVEDDRPVALRGHLARANGFWRPAVDGPVDVLVIAAGADGYVSPSWYASKAEHGRVVPTWNYEVVHLHGRMTVHDDVRWVDRLVRELTLLHEAGRREQWSVDDAPPEFIERQLRAIVGLEVSVDRFEAKRKLSQNRPEADRDGVIEALDHESPRLAGAMRRTPPR